MLPPSARIHLAELLFADRRCEGYSTGERDRESRCAKTLSVKRKKEPEIPVQASLLYPCFWPRSMAAVQVASDAQVREPRPGEARPGDSGALAFPWVPITRSRMKFHTPLMCDAVPRAVGVPGGCQRILGCSLYPATMAQDQGQVRNTSLAEWAESRGGVGPEDQPAPRSRAPEAYQGDGMKAWGRLGSGGRASVKGGC